MFEVSMATRQPRPTEENKNNLVVVWPVAFENVELGHPDATCAQISQGREVAQDLADALNKTLNDFLESLSAKKLPVPPVKK